MPSSSYRLKSVHEVKRRDGVHWEVVGEGVGRMWVCFDMWLASFCQRVIETNHGGPVYLTWIYTKRYGDKLTDARDLSTGEWAFERALEADR